MIAEILLSAVVQVGRQLPVAAKVAQVSRLVLFRTVGSNWSNANLQRGMLPPSAGWHQILIELAVTESLHGVGISSQSVNAPAQLVVHITSRACIPSLPEGVFSAARKLGPQVEGLGRAEM